MGFWGPQRWNLILVIGTMSVLCGCRSVGGDFEPVTNVPGSNGVIYLFGNCSEMLRQLAQSSAGPSRGPDVYLDGKRVGELVGNSYIPLIVAEGTHELRLEKKSVTVQEFGNKYGS